MKRFIQAVILLSVLLFTDFSVWAENVPEIYNRGEKVITENEIIFENERYYIHSDDLDSL